MPNLYLFKNVPLRKKNGKNVNVKDNSGAPTVHLHYWTEEEMLNYYQ